MRAIWKGAISFGLVHVPVKVYSATESHDVSLHQVHDEDGGRIRYERRCEICKEIVAYKHIDKAFDDGEKTIVLTDEDLKSLPAERSHEIDVVEFVPDDQIDVLRLGNPYFLEPEEKALKPYSLLRQALEETERTAVVTFALRQRTRLGALRVRDNVLVLQTLLWDDEVRTADFPVLENTAKVTQKELAMAGQLIESLAGDFDASQFTDDYQEQLKTLIEAKQKAGEGIDSEATFGVQEDEGAEVVDLMEALRRSVEARKGDEKPKKKPAKKKSSA
ncbi:Ku protein [Aeromicrobium sp. 636]|uniref:Non-homologous end joining protein Ku n=1 Tax=Aeromicrobium senzhongii TaxID=2663859 RepID=A0A8I0EXE7_9ACTN|nr:MULTISPECIES: Ku protein [Aeromicrobium]MBC9227102.1 Ku protein [Aeromicrobium senzhongii]MCQ3999202.1 Ku protein [Aeromicrobium sp. 636]MTB88491.1 Ku protein [Aeromicrobium senzhongii]QNL94547.1 Ku protein [Aeromicrobium senzhongii]